jgi:hypothetical protein
MANYPSWRCQSCGCILNEGEAGYCEDCQNGMILSKKEELDYARAIEDGQIEIAFDEENHEADPDPGESCPF